MLGLYCLGKNFVEFLLFIVPFELFAACPLAPMPLFESLALSSGVFGEDLLLCFTLFLDFMTSLFKDIGLGRPCSLRKRPHALQST